MWPIQLASLRRILFRSVFFSPIRSKASLVTFSDHIIVFIPLHHHISKLCKNFRSNFFGWQGLWAIWNNAPNITPKKFLPINIGSHLTAMDQNYTTCNWLGGHFAKYFNISYSIALYTCLQLLGYVSYTLFTSFSAITFHRLLRVLSHTLSLNQKSSCLWLICFSINYSIIDYLHKISPA